ncbi:hypothetical protein C0Z16_23015 [Paraburkholderia rhynchosiae]|uniref:Uncharacterized protein n=1 Tax=Paraburkholderia rhynchosiae TaxID=487049 RepID=A0ABX4V2P2_9BURK|nr:hypothetical protein C0Z16_23015 [Paraburkholderia rhynchosiae]
MSSIFSVFVACAAVHSQAQTSGADQVVVRTLAGALSIANVTPVQTDGVTFNVALNGAHFDQCYGSRYAYYADSAVRGKPVGRIIIEDFNGGSSDPASVSMYDFRKHPPVVLSVSDRLDVDDVRWTDDAVFPSANGRRHIFAHGKLSRSQPPASATP